MPHGNVLLAPQHETATSPYIVMKQISKILRQACFNQTELAHDLILFLNLNYL